MFLTHINEQYAYGHEVSLSRYLDWGWRNILGNIGLHALSNIKTGLHADGYCAAGVGFVGFGWFGTAAGARAVVATGGAAHFLASAVFFLHGLGAIFRHEWQFSKKASYPSSPGW